MAFAAQAQVIVEDTVRQGAFFASKKFTSNCYVGFEAQPGQILTNKAAMLVGFNLNWVVNHQYVVSAKYHTLTTQNDVRELVEPGSLNKADYDLAVADLVAYQSVAGHRDLAAIADHLAKTFRAGGFNADDVQVHREDAAPALTVRFRGRDGALPPVLFLAHMDVVPANAGEWKSDPWTLTERDGKLIARGVGDNKYGLMSLTRAFLRLRRERHVPPVTWCWWSPATRKPRWPPPAGWPSATKAPRSR